ncbi:MAG: hypothetical protein HKN21_02015 [Candidatus Eisenbacteria bacterium]|uniref:Uncharacterized protein n=1 Tax=Eiseniibacteriota bacterium TaxID=2212470 RepID=A0A7Y2H1C7_UNCEI|nr:hypothetical protein [Candidatus Eisenbacteria bacterium]
MVEFRDRPPSFAERFLVLGMGFLYFLLAGMLIYLRVGPVRRVLDRMVERGAEVPTWLPLSFTVGIGILVIFLCVRGLHALRKYRALSQ